MFESATLPVVGTQLPSGSNERASIVVPVYNEVKNLPDFLKALDDLVLPCEKELILVNDCSDDGSRELLESFDFKSSVALIHHAQNQGKGSAIRSGLAAATGTIIGIQADQHTMIEEAIRGMAEVDEEGNRRIERLNRFNTVSPY